MDPVLARELTSWRAGVPPQLAGALGTPDPAPRYGLVVYTSDVPALRRAGLRVEAAFNGFAVVRATPDEVPTVLATPGVSRVTLGEDELPHNDPAGALVGARALHQGLLGDQAYTGAGAIVCVFDTGIDFRHLDFRNPSDTTKSRILRLYDMTLTAAGAETPPAGFTTGVEYTQAHLNDELDGTPTGFVRSQDPNGHGTHVAATAVGNGSALSPRQHVGMAPDADIVFVRGGVSSFPSANILNGIAYCDNVATAFGKPMVMNMSLGSDSGPHDGQDSKSLAIKQMVESAPGRVVVQSAGNSGATALHRGGTLAPGDSVELVVTVAAAGTVADPGFGLDIWTQGRNLTLIAVTPGGTRLVRPISGDEVMASPDGNVYLYNWLVTGTNRWDGDLDRQLYVTTTGTAAGTWRIRLRNDDTVPDTWHAWAFDRAVGGGGAPLAGADALYTVSNAAPEAIAVGAYAHRWLWRSATGGTYQADSPARTDLRASFSSQGPSRDGRILPDLSAPGQMIVSALSRHSAPNPANIVAGSRHRVNQGTSMSSPVVAGSVALLLAAKPTLTFDQVKTLLRDNAIVDAAVTSAGTVPNNEFGAGKLNVYQAMARAVNAGSSSTLSTVQYDAVGATTTGVTLSAGTNLLLRFQAPTTGRMRGLTFHTSVAQPSGGYLVRLWASSGGVPGAQLGTSVVMPLNAVQPFGWNYLATEAFSADLASGAEYFVSITPQGSAGSFRHDNTAAGTRTYLAPEAAPPSPAGSEGVQDIGALAAQTFNALVRPILTSDAAALPVELVSFEGAQQGRTALLTWITASETNNAGFAVEQMGETPDLWTELAFVRGAGTTTEAQRYRFETEPLLPGRHTFRLRQVDTDGAVHYSGLVVVEMASEHVLALLPSGPNPFAGRTTLLFTVPQDGPARADLYDLLGRRVQTLFDGLVVAGTGARLVVDASALGAGPYVVRAEAGGRSVTHRLLVTR